MERNTCIRTHLEMNGRIGLNMYKIWMKIDLHIQVKTWWKCESTTEQE